MVFGAYYSMLTETDIWLLFYNLYPDLFLVEKGV